MSSGGRITKPKSSNAAHDPNAGYGEKVGDNIKTAVNSHVTALQHIADRPVNVLLNKNASTNQKAASLAIGAAEAGLAAFGAVMGAATQLSEAVMMPIMEKLAAFKGQATLPVCKQMDPVIGIDVHMIVIPPAPAPVPIPHPYVGISYRAKDFIACALASVIPTPDVAPEVDQESSSDEIDASNKQHAKAIAHQVATIAIGMLGATVKFGGFLPRTVAGTPTKNVIKHFPIGPNFHPVYSRMVEKDHGHALLGSFFVVADGSPLTGAPVHLHNDCWDIGIFSIHNIKPNRNADGSKKLFKARLYVPSGVIIPIPWTRPVITNPIPAPINPLTAPHMLLKAAFAKLKRSRKKNEEKIKNSKLPCAAKSILSFLFGTGQSHPVEVAEGYFYTDNEDFSLPGPIPLSWQRIWYSYSNYNGPLGHGWHHCYDMAIAFDYETSIAIIRMNDGRGVDMKLPVNADKPTYHRREKLWLFIHEQDKYYYVKDVNGLIYRFTDQGYTIKGSVEKQHLLQSISNTNAFAIRFNYTFEGWLEKIIDSSGRTLTIENDNKGRIAAVYAPHPQLADKNFAIARYNYTDEGDMSSHTDALSQSMLFEYQHHLMVKEIWRNGLTWNFVYNGKNSKAKCIEVWGDGDLLHYTFDYSSPGCTLVTNSLGHLKTFYHRNGQVIKYIDPNGAAWEYRYNKHCELEWSINPLGHQTGYAHDDLGNLLTVTQPDGLFTQRGYYDLRHPNQVTEVIDERGGKWLWEYDELGNVEKKINPLKAITRFEYADGLVSKIIDPFGKETSIGYDSDFNLYKAVYPNGAAIICHYDKVGNRVELQNPKGRTQIKRFDLLSRPIVVDDFDKNRIKLTYDAMDNIIFYHDDVKSVEYSYTGMNKLKMRREGNGTIYFIHDTEEQLRKVINEHGLIYTFELDNAGNVVRETGFDGLIKQYKRNVAGWVQRMSKPGDRFTDYRYDEAGRIEGIFYEDGTSEFFKYRNGQLHEAVNADATVTFEWNLLGDVISEKCNNYEVKSEYDISGNCIQMNSTLGADMSFEYDDMGDIVKQRAMGWASEITRDKLGFEIQKKIPGGLVSIYERDQIGTVLNQQVAAFDTEGRVSKLGHKRVYRWAVNHMLKQVADLDHGNTTFEYDDRGNLAKTTFSNGEEQFRNPDLVGNLFETENRIDRKYEKGGRLLKSKTASYQYNEEGFLIEKREKNGDTWKYEWNAAGMLKTVSRPDDQEISFKYDALGRRIEKRYKKTITRWFWEKNKPLHEWKEFDTKDCDVDDIITWVFNRDDYTPVAKIKGQKKYSLVSDHLGTPILAYNEEGEAVWSRELDSYGRIRTLHGSEGFCNYFYQGHMLDVETGLFYNRFRYYDPQEGRYITQDPIGLYSEEFGFYNYVHDPNGWLDVFGLAKCLLSAADKKKLREKYGDIDPAHDHHIVREKAPKNWDKEHRDYILKSQKILKDAGIGLNDDMRNFTRATNGKGAHTKAAAKHVHDKLSKSTDIEKTLGELGKEMNEGKFF